MLASGRPTFSMYDIGEQLHLKEYGSFILSFNGAKITNCKSGEELFSSTLSRETVHRLYDISRQENVWIHTYIGDHIVTEAVNQYTNVEGDFLKV